MAIFATMTMATIDYGDVLTYGDFCYYEYITSDFKLIKAKVFVTIVVWLVTPLV